MSKFTVLIPARMHSNRLAQKMIRKLGDSPLIVHTARQALKSRAHKVIVATDHEEIRAICTAYGIDSILTAEGHNSGTDRITEVVQLLNLAEDEIIINLQGDEPLIDPQLIDQLAEFIQREQTEVATLAHPIQSEEEIFNPNIVKVVLDKLQHALYFSRAPIPFYRDGFNSRSEFKLPESLNLLRHIGMYAYTARFLKSYTQMPTCPLEQVESLEQLRALYNGYKIAVLTTNSIPHGGVDTIEDLDRVRQVLINS